MKLTTPAGQLFTALDAPRATDQAPHARSGGLGQFEARN
jgi:hypothetical protein